MLTMPIKSKIKLVTEQLFKRTGMPKIWWHTADANLAVTITRKQTYFLSFLSSTPYKVHAAYFIGHL